MLSGVVQADFHPHLAGRPASALRHGLISGLRNDGLVRKDNGTLYITTHRIYFVGSGGIVGRAIRDVIQCQAGRDAIHISFASNAPAMHFIVPHTSGLLITAAAIRKLASIARSHQTPEIAA